MGWEVGVKQEKHKNRGYGHSFFYDFIDKQKVSFNFHFVT